MIKRPEFAGINSPVSTQGKAGTAGARRRRHADWPAPARTRNWIDMSQAGSARAMHREDALAFIKYPLGPESNATWKAKAFERLN